MLYIPSGVSKILFISSFPSKQEYKHNFWLKSLSMYYFSQSFSKTTKQVAHTSEQNRLVSSIPNKTTSYSCICIYIHTKYHCQNVPKDGEL